MKSGMAAVRTLHEIEFIKNETNRIIKAFTEFPESKHRASTKVVKKILINGPYLLNGQSWDVKAKSLGAGIYELKLIKVE